MRNSRAIGFKSFQRILGARPAAPIAAGARMVSVYHHLRFLASGKWTKSSAAEANSRMGFPDCP
jgi:hypothetical protein